MATYKLVSFAGVTLPIYNVQLDNPVEAPSPVVRTVNGYFDVRGTRRQVLMPAFIRMRAVVATNDVDTSGGHLYVNGGNRLVISAGNPLWIVTQSPGQVRKQVDALRALVGVRATLTRAAFAGAPSATQSISARLLAVRPGTQRGGLGTEELEMTWEAEGALWNGAAGSASGIPLVCEAGGNAPIQDATLTLTSAGAACRVTGPGIDWTFAGSGQTLVVKGWRVTANGVPATVTLGSAHTAESLVELAKDATTRLMIVNAAGASIAWNDKWV